MADGHGDSAYFRSARGAQFAAEASLETLQDFLPHLASGKVSEKCIHSRVCEAITERWITRIYEDLKKHPLTEDETLSNSRTAEEFCRYLGNVSKEQKLTLLTVLPYGTTCLVFLLTENLLLITKIGDHDVITLSRDGIITRLFPVPPIQECTSTESLILPDPSHFFDVYFLENRDDFPRVIIGATDGYGSAYKYEKDWEVYPVRDLLNCLKTMGEDTTRACLPGLLTDLSKAGASGDDISLAIIFDAETIGTLAIAKSTIKTIAGRKEKTPELPRVPDPGPAYCKKIPESRSPARRRPRVRGGKWRNTAKFLRK
jgi:hypothetical protein